MGADGTLEHAPLMPVRLNAMIAATAGNPLLPLVRMTAS